MILRKYSQATVYSVPRGRIKLTFIHRREIPGYHNSEVRETSARKSIVQNPLVVMQILLVPFIIRISTKLRRKPSERRGTKREKERGELRKETTEESLLEDSSSPAWKREIAPGWWKRGGKGERGERSFPLAFSRRKSRLVVVSRTVAAKGKNPGRSEEATRR